MKETAFKILEEIEKNGYEAYIVGGFVRDYLLGISSNDIDITTSATPKDLCNIFKDAILPNTEYGSVTIIVNQIRFEITTYRKEFNYINNRRPGMITYIQDLKEDLLRRDFTINTFCMNKNGEILDLLNAKKALKNRVIQTVKQSDRSFEEDALRILRAIRFATILDFSLSDEIEKAIFEKKGLLRTLSKERKKEELDKIFSSSNAKKGIELLTFFGLDIVLELPKLKEIKYVSQSIGIWAFLDVDTKYPFSKNEKDLMKSIRQASKNVFAPLSLYKNGLYVSSVAGEMQGISKKEIIRRYDCLPIKHQKELAIKGKDILETFKKKPGPYLNEWLSILEKEVVLGHLPNEKEALLLYCLKHQSMVG